MVLRAASLSLFAIVASAGAGACLAPSNLDEKTFPCRSPGDCIGGYFCHPTRFVCVPEGTPFDAGPARADAGPGDGGAPDAEAPRDAAGAEDAKDSPDALPVDAGSDDAGSNDAGSTDARARD